MSTTVEYLMSRFAACRSPWVAEAIVQQLENLVHCERQDIEHNGRLLAIWTSIVHGIAREEAPADHDWRMNILSFLPVADS